MYAKSSRFHLGLLMLSTLLFDACASYVSVQKTLSPEIILPEEHADFLFVNRFQPDDLDFNNENKVEVFEMGVNNYISGLKYSFDTCRRFNLVLSDAIIPSHSAYEPAYSLSKEIIAELHQNFNSDYIFSLDNYHLYFDQEVDVQENDDGSKSKTAYYDLVLNTYITIYNIDGDAVNKLKDERRVLHDERGVLSGLFAVGPSMGKADKNVIRISDELGRMFIQKFYPAKISEMRKFYATKNFRSAFNAYYQRDWDKVEKELMQLTKHPDRKMQGRAAYNLSVLYENLGRIDEMEFWYRRAEEMPGSIPKMNL